MELSTASLIATATTAALKILGLLIACFGAILALAMFARVVSGAGRHMGRLIIGAAVVLVALVFFAGGPRGGGGAFWNRWSTSHLDNRNRVTATAAREAAETAQHFLTETQHLAAETRAAVEAQADALVEEVRSIGVIGATSEPTVVVTLPGGPSMLEVPIPPETGETPRPPTLRSKARSMSRELRRIVRHPDGGWIAGSLVTAFALAAFLYVGYLFLDAGTRGQFTWSLRIVSLVAFLVFLAVFARWTVH